MNKGITSLLEKPSEVENYFKSKNMYKSIFPCRKEDIKVYKHLDSNVLKLGDYAIVLSDINPFPWIQNDTHFESSIQSLSEELKDKCRDLYYNELKNPENYICNKYVLEIWYVPNGLKVRQITTDDSKTRQVLIGYKKIKEIHAALR